MTDKAKRRPVAPKVAPVTVFFYGTLRKSITMSGPNEELLEERATIRGLRLGTPHGGWPAAFESNVEGAEEFIVGQVWRMPGERLQFFDQYEGVNTGLFRRVELITAETETRVQVYLWGAPEGAKLAVLPPGTEWPTNDAHPAAAVVRAAVTEFRKEEDARIAAEEEGKRAERQRAIDAVRTDNREAVAQEAGAEPEA